MVEQANGVLKHKIAAWRSDYQSSSWVSSLPEVIGGMNSQQSSVTGRSPYDITFGQAPHGNRVSYLERDIEEVEEEGQVGLGLTIRDGAFQVASDAGDEFSRTSGARDDLAGLDGIGIARATGGLGLSGMATEFGSGIAASVVVRSTSQARETRLRERNCGFRLQAHRLRVREFCWWLWVGECRR
jgi:hypothetical protein